MGDKKQTAKEFAEQMATQPDVRPSNLIKQAYAAMYKQLGESVTDEVSSLACIGAAMEMTVEMMGKNEVGMRIAFNAVSLALRAHYEAIVDGGWTRDKMLFLYNKLGSEHIAHATAKEEMLLASMRTSDADDAVAFLKAELEEKNVQKIDLSGILSSLGKGGTRH